MKHPALLPFVLLLAAAGPAQDLPLSPALERAIAADELEHDVPRAKDLLRAVAEDAAQPEPVRRHAWLRLARLQRRLGEDAADALARAAVGEDAVAAAARELQAQGKEDVEREAELQRRAAEAVEAAVNNWQDNGTRNNALWFGVDAVPAAIRKFEELYGDSVRGSRTAALLWILPGERAAQFLEHCLRTADVVRRRAVASGIEHILNVSVFPNEKLGLVRLALRDADEDVVVRMLAVGGMTSSEDLLPLCLDVRDNVRLRALHALAAWAGSRFPGAAATPDRRAHSEAIAAAMPRMLATTVPEEYAAALAVSLISGLFSRAGRSVLAQHVTAVRGRSRGYHATMPEGDIQDWDGRAENARVLRDAFVHLSGKERSSAHEVAAQMAEFYVARCWDGSALDAVLTAWRLGYAQCYADWLRKNARDQDAGTVVAGLAGNGVALRQAALWFARLPLPESAFQHLRAALSSAPDSTPDEELVLAIGRTGHPQAATTLLEVGRARPEYDGVCMWALCRLASLRRDEPVRSALASALSAMQPRSRGGRSNGVAAAVGTLVHLGDVDVLSNLDRIKSLGHSEVSLSSVPVGEDWHGGVASPLEWLTLAQQQADGTWRWWHGYTPEQYRGIWQRLLTPVDGRYDEEAWRLADLSLRPLPDAGGADSQLVRIIVDAVHGRIVTDAEIPDVDVVRVLLNAAEAGTVPASVRADVEALSEAAFMAPEEDVRVAAIRSLTFQVDESKPVSLDATDRARLLRALSDPSPRVSDAATEPFRRSLLPVDREVVEHAFRTPHAESRHAAFQLLHQTNDDLADLLARLLRDPSVLARRAACAALGSSLRLDAVPVLLEALKDPQVREAATQSLQAIRFYHDEKAHWDQVFAGRAGLTAASAASALLEQAKPGNDPATRVLAIRSLGVLGAPETQPFLIEWTKDADAEVAAAAREAVGRIHAGKGR